MIRRKVKIVLLVKLKEKELSKTDIIKKSKQVISENSI